MSTPYYAIQPAFTGGEISEDVASRVDLDKYQLALLQAENTIIKPYGSIRKRSGSKYCGTTKNNGKAILKRFEYSAELAYLLEFGVGYVRVWKDGAYLGVELATPYSEGDLKNIRTVQSVDVMYICTGNHPVYKLMRYAENNWQLVQATWTLPPFAEINGDEGIKIQPSGITGNILINSNVAIFNDGYVGFFVKIKQRVKSQQASAWQGAPETGVIPVGKSWKIQTTGSWNGEVKVYVSYDNGQSWEMKTKYTSNEDYNAIESGTEEEYCWMKAKMELTGGWGTVSITALPYVNEGYVKITAVNSSTQVVATVLRDKQLGSTDWTPDFYLSVWNGGTGYPYTATFFQDRLCFGGCPKYPQRVWMSRTGDYENFEVEKEDGNVTDDSAVTADLLSLRSYKISHMYASSDLVVLTEGNTWIISGSETVTPSNISPRNDENYGCNHVEPTKVGGRMVYVNRRGNMVRDVGYSYDSDSYTGLDLTLLAKHLVHDTTIIDAAYEQYPDSTIYFVRSDGVILSFSYEPSQKVYAWSHFKTDGKYEAVASIGQGNNDRIYTIVNRTVGGATKRYIELFDLEKTSVRQQDYHMLDSFIEKSGGHSSIITGLGHLEGKKVQVLADNYYYDDKEYVVTNGQITLPEPVQNAVVGLPYTMIIEQANFDVGNTEQGTIQGRMKTVTAAILRLIRSYGGSIGPNASAQNKIIYDPERMERGEDVLYTGDKEVVLGTGGYNIYGRTYIIQNEPYPFVLSAIIREVNL